MKKILAVSAAVFVALMFMATSEYRFDLNNSGFPLWIRSGLYIGTAASNPPGNVQNKVTRILGASSTVDFASTTVGTIESSGITVTGAQTGDPCFVGATAAGGALTAEYSCYVSAADTVKIKFTPQNFAMGSMATGGGGGSVSITATVPLNSTCLCSNATGENAVSCGVGGGGGATVLTGTSIAAQTIKYLCATAVDPASGTFYVRVISSQ